VLSTIAARQKRTASSIECWLPRQQANGDPAKPRRLDAAMAAEYWSANGDLVELKILRRGRAVRQMLTMSILLTLTSAPACAVFE